MVRTDEVPRSKTDKTGLFENRSTGAGCSDSLRARFCRLSASEDVANEVSGEGAPLGDFEAILAAKPIRLSPSLLKDGSYEQLFTFKQSA